MVNLPEFTPGLAAARVDASLRLAMAAVDRAQECAVLWFAEVAQRGLFRELGYPSLELYATEGLGFSHNRFCQFARLADDLDRLPRLREAVVSGTLGWTKAQQVARVATATSEERWVAKAATVGRRELEAEVKLARAKARQRRAGRVAPELAFATSAGESPAASPPTTLSLRLDGVQLAQYEALVERAHKLGLVPAGASREEVLLAGLAALVEGGDLRRRKAPKSLSGVQIVVKECPACERAAVVTSRGEKVIDPAHAEALACDARVREEDGPNRATIPPSVRAKVLVRDGHRCTTPGCEATQFLEVHHLTPRSAGGTNRAENLTTLCSRCHRFSHEHGRASSPAR
jgi:5-methylcytosine-specific restriction endonuclease McrA